MESETRTPAPTPTLADLPMRVGSIDIATGSDELELVFSRRFEAPRSLVFRAFSSCEHLVHWWGPTGWTLPVCKQDFRTGGTPTFGPVFDAIERAIRDGELRQGDPLEVTLAITSPAMGLIQLYHGGRINLPEPEFRALCKRTIERILNGLRP